jgi:hypothetical protein
MEWVQIAREGAEGQREEKMGGATSFKDKWSPEPLGDSCEPKEAHLVGVLLPLGCPGRRVWSITKKCFCVEARPWEPSWCFSYPHPVWMSVVPKPGWGGQTMAMVHIWEESGLLTKCPWEVEALLPLGMNFNKFLSDQNQNHSHLGPSLRSLWASLLPHLQDTFRASQSSSYTVSIEGLTNVGHGNGYVYFKWLENSS